MNWQVRVPTRVGKSLRKFPEGDRGQILEVLNEFENDPWRGDIVKIKGVEHLWRRRVGNYRIFYSVAVDARIIEIKEIKRRTSDTY